MKLILLFLILIHSAHAGEIHQAIKNQDINTVQSILESNPHLVHDQDEDGQTPLHLAVEAGNQELITLLTSSFPSDQSIKNKQGLTPWSLIDSEDYPHIGFKEAFSNPEVQKKLKSYHLPTSPKPTIIAVHQNSYCALNANQPGSSDAKYIQASNTLLTQAQDLQLPILFLMSPGDYRAGQNSGHNEHWSHEWITGADIEPTSCFTSEFGEHHLPLATSEVILIGAYWSICHLRAATDAIKNHFTSKKNPLTLHLPIQAIHTFKSQPLLMLSNSKLSREVFAVFSKAEENYCFLDYEFHAYINEVEVFDTKAWIQDPNPKKVNIKLWRDLGVS